MILLIFLAGLALLYIGGEVFVRAAAALGEWLHMSPLVAGLTIVAFATSAPELAISLGAAINGVPDLAIGNVVGSNICNIALILGLTALIKPIPISRTLVPRDLLVMSLATLLIPALLLNGTMGRAEGLGLLVSIAIYVTLTIRHTRATRKLREPVESVVPAITDNPFFNLLLAAFGIVVLVFGSDLLVDSSVRIADTLGVPHAVVGLSVAALGSSLPELTAAIIAARHGQPEMAAGNLIGSNIFNLLLILGATSLVSPLEMRSVSLIDLAVMICVTALAILMMRTRSEVARREGTVLVVIYCLYMAWLYIR